ncbi:MAG: hypothetical protein A2831_02790 [Candidatus Yanofskybacteria bacterium RIFCSPHIGHO2_01_FULL_44_17]|uniref:Uncharacterized protein n=1 Tax=Candidatus Yanofskybacteria bacterium RIFCSPHIGHO2_01_FULL_44_17 TaxID=1802668 RepID=A0A1F8EVU7_9BACT|nr:MAG: hypothetical protein A2831_02790 [Candidatus Yanofskybacteria bacterium RIFCSPHIGHO2_01_FULL_44_17]
MLKTQIYGIDKFEQDLIPLGLDLRRYKEKLKGYQSRPPCILPPMLSAAFDTWLSDLVKSLEKPRRKKIIYDAICATKTTKRDYETEAFLVVNRSIVRVINERVSTWKDYNGEKFYTQKLEFSSNNGDAIEILILNFKKFIETRGLEQLRAHTMKILPFCSSAHLWPKEVSCFYLPETNSPDIWFPQTKHADRA